MVICQVPDLLTEATLYFMVVFSPWAFGTTQDWSISVMNTAGYSLGVLLLVKWMIRWRLGHLFSQPGDSGQTRKAGLTPKRNLSKLLTAALVCLTCVLLAYGAIGALNARAIYHSGEMRFEFLDHLAWLPNTYDRVRTWKAVANFLALALAFWATRDWLLGPGTSEGRPDQEKGRKAPFLPARLQRLLWVLALNGALLAMEGILQKLEGSGKLLWLVRPTISHEAESQFGPYAYRSNAAQYFNLVWPVCLGFWWALHRGSSMPSEKAGRRGNGAHILLLPATMIVAACPFIAASRGGAAVTVVQMAAVLMVFFAAYRRRGWRMILVILLIFAGTSTMAGYWGWNQMAQRLRTTSAFDLSGRDIIYENARRMVHDFPVFGTGPGTFAPLYQFYLASPEQDWVAQAHNDWLETRITFGLAGFTLILLALLTVIVRWFCGNGIAVSSRFAVFFWVSLGGCLLHARFDFPLQIYSILFLFVLLCSILFCLSRRTAA